MEAEDLPLGAVMSFVWPFHSSQLKFKKRHEITNIGHQFNAETKGHLIRWIRKQRVKQISVADMLWQAVIHSQRLAVMQQTYGARWKIGSKQMMQQS